MDKVKRVLRLSEGYMALDLFGIRDENLRLIEKTFNVRLLARGDEVTLEGDPDSVEGAEKLLKELDYLFAAGHAFTTDELLHLVKASATEDRVDIKELYEEQIKVSTKRRTVVPKSRNQKDYVRAIREYDLVIAIGPAGTGKTYLAMAMGVSGLLEKRHSRIILTRPAVEAGEKLGYLPGDLFEKVNPYLRPLYDALYDMMDFEMAQKLQERGTIEVAPLAYMRGRTLNDSFIILDEAQNTTSEQMKMFLTRMGFNSKVVITGDITQVDLPTGKRSGLIEVQSILHAIKGIRFVYFNERDVVRHELVQKVVKAYERYEEHARNTKGGEGSEFVTGQGGDSGNR